MTRMPLINKFAFILSVLALTACGAEPEPVAAPAEPVVVEPSLPAPDQELFTTSSPHPVLLPNPSATPCANAPGSVPTT